MHHEHFVLNDAEFVKLIGETKVKSPWGYVNPKNIAALDLFRNITTKDDDTENSCAGVFDMLDNVYLIYGLKGSDNYVRENEKPWSYFLDKDQQETMKKLNNICLGWCIANRSPTDNDRVIVHWVRSYVEGHGIGSRLISELQKEFKTNAIFPENLHNAPKNVLRFWKRIGEKYELDYDQNVIGGHRLQQIEDEEEDE